MFSFAATASKVLVWGRMVGIDMLLKGGTIAGLGSVSTADAGMLTEFRPLEVMRAMTELFAPG